MQSLCLKLQEATQMFVVVGHVTREMTAKKSCKYGEYGSFEHLLFLLKKPKDLRCRLEHKPTNDNPQKAKKPECK